MGNRRYSAQETDSLCRLATEPQGGRMLTLAEISAATGRSEAALYGKYYGLVKKHPELADAATRFGREYTEQVTGGAPAVYGTRDEKALMGFLELNQSAGVPEVTQAGLDDIVRAMGGISRARQRQAQYGQLMTEGARRMRHNLSEASVSQWSAFILNSLREVPYFKIDFTGVAEGMNEETLDALVSAGIRNEPFREKRLPAYEARVTEMLVRCVYKAKSHLEAEMSVLFQSGALQTIYPPISERHQELFSDIYVRGSRQADIARQTGVTRAAVHQALNAAHRWARSSHRLSQELKACILAAARKVLDDRQIPYEYARILVDAKAVNA